MYTCIHIYIYRERERDVYRERERDCSLSRSDLTPWSLSAPGSPTSQVAQHGHMCVDMYVYIYIYIYM